MRLNHETADERPPIDRKRSCELEHLRPRFAPAAGGLGDDRVCGHARSDCRFRIRSPAALLVRSSP